MTQPIRFFSPTETAQRLGVTVKALRVYEAQGLVRPVRTAAGWRAYGPEQMARLHQVLALKRLGLPLKRIAELIAGRLADLDAVLALQEQALRLRKSEVEQGLVLLAQARGRLERGEALSMDDLTQLTRETTMSENQLRTEDWKTIFRPLADKHFTEKELWEFASRQGAEGPRIRDEWSDLIGEGKALMAQGVAPSSPKAMDLAVRWMALIRRVTGPDGGMIAKVRDIWDEALQDEEFRRRSPVPPELMAFAGDAIRCAVAAGLTTFP